jgi:hypothetical protein
MSRALLWLSLFGVWETVGEICMHFTSDGQFCAADLQPMSHLDIVTLRFRQLNASVAGTLKRFLVEGGFGL